MVVRPTNENAGAFSAPALFIEHPAQHPRVARQQL
jgi:hypothetical protein